MKAAIGAGRSYSEATAKVVDDEVERILQECYAEGVRLLREHRDALDRLAQTLLERETLDEKEILRVTQLPPAPRTDESPRASVPEPIAAFSEARPGA